LAKTFQNIIDFKANILIEGTQGFDDPSDVATIYLGNTTQWIKGTYYSSGNFVEIYGDDGIGFSTQHGTNAMTINEDGLTFGGDFTLLNPRTPPTYQDDTGSVGEITYDSTYLYICVAANSWLRFADDTIWPTRP